MKRYKARVKVIETSWYEFEFNSDGIPNEEEARNIAIDELRIYRDYPIKARTEEIVESLEEVKD